MPNPPAAQAAKSIHQQRREVYHIASTICYILSGATAVIWVWLYRLCYISVSLLVFLLAVLSIRCAFHFDARSRGR